MRKPKGREWNHDERVKPVIENGRKGAGKKNEQCFGTKE